MDNTNKMHTNKKKKFEQRKKTLRKFWQTKEKPNYFPSFIMMESAEKFH